MRLYEKVKQDYKAMPEQEFIGSLPFNENDLQDLLEARIAELKDIGFIPKGDKHAWEAMKKVNQDNLYSILYQRQQDAIIHKLKEQFKNKY